MDTAVKSYHYGNLSRHRRAPHCRIHDRDNYQFAPAVNERSSLDSFGPIAGVLYVSEEFGMRFRLWRLRMRLPLNAVGVS